MAESLDDIVGDATECVPGRDRRSLGIVASRRRGPAHSVAGPLADNEDSECHGVACHLDFGQHSDDSDSCDDIECNSVFSCDECNSVFNPLVDTYIPRCPACGRSYTTHTGRALSHWRRLVKASRLQIVECNSKPKKVHFLEGEDAEPLVEYRGPHSWRTRRPKNWRQRWDPVVGEWVNLCPALEAIRLAEPLVDYEDTDEYKDKGGKGKGGKGNDKGKDKGGKGNDKGKDKAKDKAKGASSSSSSWQ